MQSAASAEGSVTIAGDTVTFVPKSAYIGDAVVKIMMSDGREGYATRDFSTLVKAAAIDAPTSYSLNVSHTDTIATISCSLSDADDVKNVVCTLEAEDGRVIRSWAGGNETITGLTSGAAYVARLTGNVGQRQKDDTVILVPFPPKVEVFRMDNTVVTPVCPPGYVPDGHGNCV